MKFYIVFVEDVLWKSYVSAENWMWHWLPGQTAKRLVLNKSQYEKCRV